jgi:serine/threonine-protein kinase
MGVVYVVEHAHTGDQLALKLLHGRAARDPQSIERFKREARASARIKSDHVVKVVDADVAPELENAPFLVMELLDGTDLEKLVETRGGLPPAEVLEYLTQAARALDKSHALGIIHRDLKPENLFLHRREDGSAILKILDFGISKIIGTEAGGDMTGAGMTSTGAVMGTPLYMAPEQARGLVSQIGAQTDVWAVGLIALHLLTGEIYWQANTVAELMVHILAQPFYPPTQRWPWLPPAFDAWFARSCAREPSERFPSAGQQVEALGGALGLRGVGFASTFQALVPPPARPASAATSQLPGASTTNHPHALGTSGVPHVPRSKVVPAALAASSLLVAVLGGAAWIVHARSASVQAAASLPPPPVDAAPLTVATSARPAAVIPSPLYASAPVDSSSTPSGSPSASSVPAPRPAPVNAAPPASHRAPSHALPAASPPPATLPTTRPTFAPVSP